MEFTGLFFHESTHFLVASFLSILFFWKFRSKKLILIIFASTFLIDMDHIVDYYNFSGNLRIWNFFSGFNIFVATQKVIVPLHSWELVIILGAWGWFKRMPAVLAVSLAFGGHILIDQFSYMPNPVAYFLILRATHNFSHFWFNNFYF